MEEYQSLHHNHCWYTSTPSFITDRVYILNFFEKLIAARSYEALVLKIIICLVVAVNSLVEFLHAELDFKFESLSTLWELLNCLTSLWDGDAESLQPSKKRAAVKELSRDNPGLDDDNESSEQESGTFKRASDEVMASRRIVKVRKTASTTTTPSSNPFASIQLVPPADTSTTPAVTTTEAGSGTTTSKESEESNDQSEATKKDETDENREVDHEKETDENSKLPESKSDESKADVNVDKEKVENPNGAKELESTEKKAEESTVVEKSANGTEVKGNKSENEEEKQVGDGKNEKGAEAASFSSFQQLSSNQNAFTGLAGTGFSNTTFSSFGASSKEGSPLGFGSESGACSGSLFGLKSDQSFFGPSLPTNGNASGSSSVKKGEGTGFPSMQEVPVETGEEHEKAIFTANSVLFEYLNGVWNERGKGELKLDISSTGTGKARLVMRTRGNYSLQKDQGKSKEAKIQKHILVNYIPSFNLKTR
ncbi:hypothetical protein RND71_005434 [Anisodus tanguticus]|uniref:RanBD1 domain-containing protein n=1 Tax=Anisodus tanguticus TaxID=243964 RepID=A0AAE1SRI5_9SOLA|nr:hypothetical protein RND71_005434 [Anisodus tanguticus]